MKISHIVESSDACPVCGQTPCNCTHIAEGSETAADIDKKIEFHKQGQAAAQYKGAMNKMHAKKIKDLEAKKAELKQGVAEGSNVDSQIKRIKDRILQLKDWNTAGTHDKKIKELQARLKELQSQKQGVAEGDKPEAHDEFASDTYSDPPEADYGDDYQAMVGRVKKLAGMGPLKTVYDPQKRVYKNIPTATQPKK